MSEPGDAGGSENPVLVSTPGRVPWAGPEAVARNCLAISTPLSSRVLTGIYGLVPRAGSRAPKKPPGPSARARMMPEGLAWGGVGELGPGLSGNIEVEIDAVEQEARGRGGRDVACRRPAERVA
jgi:hypothetical protein